MSWSSCPRASWKITTAVEYTGAYKFWITTMNKDYISKQVVLNKTVLPLKMLPAIIEALLRRDLACKEQTNMGGICV